ncbi:phosphate acetyltransferase [Octadecabacter temperatus]|uniref:Phosphate acetyltransferase n=1 Tax=Octadecabacter temperatus TaxID=1458307 RepID=A0A0K0Y8M0_9RHOB|nr:phosphate acyltransferase [Octadecabacter temperatus]AKS47318.1 Phosphate acetyltransferase [Octadecabacter temperatus]SIO44048.1 phosphate acetyltransferase [Octadecabacter temperatus]
MSDYPFQSKTAPVAPARLMTQARRMPTPRVALVNAGAVTPLAGIREAQEAGLADPILIGDETKIRSAADEIGYDISTLRLIHAPHAEAAVKAAELARNGEADAIMKGQVHTSTFLKGLLPSKAGLRDKGTRCGHVFHITAPGSDRPLLLTDAALNVDPSVETRQACLTHAVHLAKTLGNDRPKAALLAPTEDPIPSIANTMESAAIATWARDHLPDADVAGPIAMDLILSKDAAAVKGYDSPVAGDADIIVSPNITTGNALFKLMVIGMGCCAGGIVIGAKVPILLTSRSQKSPARLASAALGAVLAGAAV